MPRSADLWTRFFLKSAGLGDAASAGAHFGYQGVAGAGRGLWNTAGLFVKSPVRRVGLLAGTGLAAASQIPESVARYKNDVNFIRGTSPAPSRGF